MVAAFEDAMKLVQRIRDQREKTEHGPLPEEPTRDLLESLSLGPIIVRGHYDHDLRRFGEQYACGDIQAREQMKDVLINLQMTLLITLRTVWMDEMDIDFLALQTASDDCRVNAGVCLGQLSQRLSDAAKAQAMYSQNVAPSYSSGSTLKLHPSPSLAYSSSRSTNSSSTFTPRTPPSILDQFANMNVSPPVQRPLLDRKTSTTSGSSHYSDRPLPNTGAQSDPYTTLQPTSNYDRDTDAASLRRPSSHTLAPEDVSWLSPGLQTQPARLVSGTLVVGPDADRDSFISNGESHGHSSSDVSRTPSTHQTSSAREPYSPSDYGNQPRLNGNEFAYSSIYEMQSTQPTMETRQPTSVPFHTIPENSHTTFEHVRYLQQYSRPPIQGLGSLQMPQPPRPRVDSLNNMNSRPTAQNSIRSPQESGVYPPYPLGSSASPSVPAHIPNGSRGPNSASQLLTASSPHPLQSVSSTGSPSNSLRNAPVVPTGPLNLPTEKNLYGFCKGAFRLQAGFERKAFGINNRPQGFSGMVAFWRCEKCNFEGPIHNSVVTEGKKKGKPDRTFDPKVRVSLGGGVRYRWIFLAKCHVTVKSTIEGNKDGSFGSYSCIFCCAEGHLRGWTSTSNGDAASTTGSIKSTSTSGGAATYGNIESFLDHLEMHRKQDGWPNAEMLGRMKCVVGRVARPDEEWDVNFVPVQ